MVNLVDSLTVNVEAALMSDHRTSNVVIDVGSYQGIVTLSGRVDSVSTAKAAEEIAYRQEGVIRVINSLEVDQDEKELEYHTPAKQDFDFE